MTILVAAFLHVLVFVYWLGGDLGAFYGSRLMLDPKRPIAGRAAAAQILGAVDMAPRSALILTLPTGLSLAAAKGYLPDLPIATLLPIAWLAAAAWLGLVWYLHVNHLPSTSRPALVDAAIRVGLVVVLVMAAGEGALLGQPLADFLRYKFLLLALAIICGLTIRILMRPFGALIGPIMRGEGNDQIEAQARAMMARARVFVIAIWVLISAAALCGLAQQA